MKRRRVLRGVSSLLGAVLLAGWLAPTALAQCEGQGNATLVMKGRCDIGSTLKFKIAGAPSAKYRLFSDSGDGPVDVPGVGVICLDRGPDFALVDEDRLNGRGVSSIVTEIPDDPGLIGETLAFQGIVLDGDAPNGVAITNGYSFTICAEGTGGDVCIPCDEPGEPCSCGISEIAYIAPVYYDGGFPTMVEVNVASTDDPDSPFGSVMFEFDPDNPPAFPIASGDGSLVVTKVTAHQGVVVIFAEAYGDNLPGGALPAETLFETFVGDEKLNREIVTNCDEPIGPGFKFAPFFVARVVTIECETFDCPITLDFETEDDFATPLVNGQDVSTPPEFGEVVAISSDGNNQGAAAFDTDPNGPNGGGPDPDLLVDLGNVLILQSNDDPEQTVDGIFDTPNDSAAGGSLVFDFVYPSELFAIDLIDIESAEAIVTLIDGEGRMRVYFVPAGWTTDINSEGPPGFGTLDLTTLDDQPGESATATATEDAGFDPSDVLRLEVFLGGSGATDNIVLCPDTLR